MTTMRATLVLALMVPALALAGCGKTGDSGNTSAGTPGKPVAAVAPPQGKRWSDVVAATPAGGFVMGNPDAPLKLIEFASYTCPHCREFAEAGNEPLIQKYVESGKLSFEFRAFVRDPIDITVALLARCAGKETFFPLKDQFFANQNAMFQRIQTQDQALFENAMQGDIGSRFVKVAELAGLIEFVKQRGIAETQARACLADAQAVEAVAKSNETASEQFKISGTPSFVLNGQPLENTATWPVLETKLRDAGA